MKRPEHRGKCAQKKHSHSSTSDQTRFHFAGEEHYHHAEIVGSCRCSPARAAKLHDAACAHGVVSAASSHATHQPDARLRPLRRTVAHAANEVGIDGLLRLWVAAADKGREGVAFRALRRVVHVFGAHAPVLVQPLGCEVDGGWLMWVRGGGV